MAVVFAGVTLLLGSPPAAAEGNAADIAAAMQQWQANNPETAGNRGRTPGLIARWDAGGTQVTVDVGVKKPNGNPVTEKRDVNDRFRAGSNTKMLMSVVMLRLIDAGTYTIDGQPLTLDSPIPLSIQSQITGCNIMYQAWYGGNTSELCFDASKITIRSLLQHTSGLESYDKIYDWQASVGADFLLGPNGPLRDGQYYLAQLLADGVSQGPLFPADCGRSTTDAILCPSKIDKGFYYSNTNYVVLAMIMRQLTNKSYGQLITEQILQPVGMTQSKMPASWNADEKTGVVRDLDNPHSEHWTGLRLTGTDPKDPTPLGPYDATRFNPTLTAGAGDLMSTTADLIKFDKALLGGQLLSSARLADMMSWYTQFDETDESLAYNEAADGVDNDLDGLVDETTAGTVPGDLAEANHPSVTGDAHMTYGLGLSMRTFDCPSVPGKSVTVYGHNGFVPGSLTYNYITPDGGKAMAFNLNADWPAKLRPYKGKNSGTGAFDVDLYWNYELVMMYDILRAGFC
ncbi:serine hydrolase domain-containing protein [Actinocorallia aurea]